MALNSQSQSKTQKPSLSPTERMQEAAIKEMEKQTKVQTASRLQQGQTPDQILQSLSGATQPQAPQVDPNQLTQMLAQLVQQKLQPATTGDKLQAGLTVLTGGLIPTPGYARIANQRKNPLDINDLTGILNLQTQMSEASRREGSSARKAPGETAKSEREQILLNQEKAALGDPEAIGYLNSLNGGVKAEEDPAINNLNPSQRKQFLEQETKRIGENRVDLDKFTATAQPLVQRFMRLQDIAEEMKDYKPGVLNQIVAKGDVIAGKFGADPKITRYNSTLNRMLGLLVRLGGDTGAFSDPEQKRQLEAAGTASTPLGTKVQLINDFMEDMFMNIDTKKELAQYPNYEKRFPLIGKARERYEKNKEVIASSEGGDSVEARISAISKATGAKITYGK